MIAKLRLMSGVRGKKTIIKPDYSSDYLPIELTATPAKILKVLIENPDQLLTMETLIEKTWEGDKEFNVKTNRLVDVNLVSVRSFIEDCELDYEILKFGGKYIYFKTLQN